MIKNPLCSLATLSVLSSGVLAQLSGDYNPDLSSVEIPVFQGATLSGAVSATDFSVDLVQGLTSSRITGSGTVSASDVYDDGTITVGSIDGDLNLSASVAITGRVVRLSGAKATLANVTGTGSVMVDGESYGVTVTSVTGAYTIRNMALSLDSLELTGVVPAGSLRMSGHKTDYPNVRRSVSARYTQEDFGPFDFPGTIISPSLSLEDLTTTRNRISGTATGSFGDYDEVAFKVTGTRNARSGISALTLTSTSVKGVSAKINLDAEGEKSGTKNTLNVLGYKLTF